MAAYPRGFWGTNYYASADGAAAGNTDVVLYNPDLTNTITITWTTTAGTGTFTLAPKESARFQTKTGGYVPQGSALYLTGTDKFWGFSDIGVNSGNYDWGYSLVPDYLLSDEQAVSFAPGNAPTLACDAAEGRDGGLFITPAFDNTTFFIDKNADNVPDTDASIEVLRGTTPVAANASGGYTANRLQSLYITGSNSGTAANSICDLTGARIWATGPFTMTYGENPDKADAALGLDLGYTVLPNPGDWMDLVLTVDKSTNPVVVSSTAGATPVTYTLEVKSHEFDVDAVSVVDTLPASWAYQAGSTTITLPNLTTITGASANPTGGTGPTLTWGSGVLGSMLPNQTITITFQARTTANFLPGSLTRNQVQATGTRTVGGVTQTFNARDFVFNTYQTSTVNLGITKTSSVPQATPVSPGDTLTYTVTVNNPGSSTAPLTNVWINDVIPNGTSYVAGSGQVAGCSASARTCATSSAPTALREQQRLGELVGGWSETDARGGGRVRGRRAGRRATALRLQLRVTANVRDQFDTAGSATGSNGTVQLVDELDGDRGGNAGTTSRREHRDRCGDAGSSSRTRRSAGDCVSRSRQRDRRGRNRHALLQLGRSTASTPDAATTSSCSTLGGARGHNAPDTGWQRRRRAVHREHRLSRREHDAHGPHRRADALEARRRRRRRGPVRQRPCQLQRGRPAPTIAPRGPRT